MTDEIYRMGSGVKLYHIPEIGQTPLADGGVIPDLEYILDVVNADGSDTYPWIQVVEDATSPSGYSVQVTQSVDGFPAGELELAIEATVSGNPSVVNLTPWTLTLYQYTATDLIDQTYVINQLP